MKGLDTNVLVRFLTQDDPIQAPIASRFIERECTADSPGYINRVVLCELVWVLETSYRYPRQRIADVLDKMLRTAEFEIESHDAALEALADYVDGTADFSDSLIGQTNVDADCSTTVTFDRAAAQTGHFELLG